MKFKLKQISLGFVLLIAIFLTITGCSNVKKTTSSETKNISESPSTSSENQGITLYCNNSKVEVAPDDLIPTKEYAFPDGTKIFTTQHNARIILMINGTYEPNVQVKIIDNVLTVPIKAICERLDFKVDWLPKSNSMIASNDDLTLTFKVDDKVVLINNENFTLELPPKIVENTIYVPLMFICDKLNLDIKYYKPFKLNLLKWNPIITVDQKLNQPYLSEEEAYKYLKSHLDEAYNHFEDNYKKLYDPDDCRLTESSSILKEHINNLKCVGSVSRYYIFEGLHYTIYLDKYNSDVYFYISAISSSNVKKVEFDDPKLFQHYYMAG